MSVQGIASIPNSDIPVPLAQQPGSEAPDPIFDASGAQVATSALTALFDQSGKYVGSYGIDPSTGSFSAWDASGDETSFQAFAAEHDLANGATPFSANGSAVLYNSSGQIIGLDVAGYVVNSAKGQHELTTTVYNAAGAEAGPPLTIEAGNIITVGNTSLKPELESQGFTNSEIMTVTDALAANPSAGWGQTTLGEQLEQAVLQDVMTGSSDSFGTMPSSVYTASGDYVGTFAISDGSYVLTNQSGTIDGAPILANAGISQPQESAAAQIFTTSNSPHAGAAEADLASVDAAYSAYLVSAAPSDSLLNAVDLYTSDGLFEGAVGVDASSNELAYENAAGSLNDLNFALTYAPPGHTSQKPTVDAAVQGWTSGGEISANEVASIQAIVPQIQDLALSNAIATDPVLSLTPAEISALTTGQLSEVSPEEIALLSSAQVEAFSADQLDSLSSYQLESLAAHSISAQVFASITPSALESLNSSEFTSAQISALGTNANELSTFQIAELIGPSVAAIDPQALPGFGFYQLDTLLADHGTDLSTSQIDAITGPQLASQGPALTESYLSASGVDALTPAQLDALSASQIEGISPDAFACLTPLQLQALGSSQISFLTPAQVAVLSNAQIAALSNAQVGALTPAQIGELGSSQLDAFSVAQLASLTPSQISAITEPQTTGLSQAQETAIQSAEILGLINAANLTQRPTYRTMLSTEGQNLGSAGGLQDGVYIGFCAAGQNGASMAHSFIEVVSGGLIVGVFSYGADSDLNLVEMNSQYDTTQASAVSMFLLTPPAGVSQDDFMSNALAAGAALDDYLANNPTGYAPVLGGDCYTASAAIAIALGVDPSDFQAAADAVPSLTTSLLGDLLAEGAAATDALGLAQILAVSIVSDTGTNVAGTTAVTMYLPGSDGTWLPVIATVTVNALGTPAPVPGPPPLLPESQEEFDDFESMSLTGDFQIDVSSTTTAPFTL